MPSAQLVRFGSVSRRAGLLLLVLALPGCGGGGSSGGNTPQPTPTLAPAATLTASAADAAVNTAITLTWSSQNATGCTAGGAWSGALASSGSQSITAAKAATYSISCSGAGGTATATAVLTVWEAPTVNVSVDSTNVLAGAAVTVTWTSQNTKTCTPIGALTGTLATSGTQASAALTSSASVGVACTNPAFTTPVTASAAVTVSPTYSLLVSAKYEALGAGVISPSTGYLVPNWANPVITAIPYVWIELQRPDGSVAAGSYADANGEVLFTGLSPAIKYTPVIQSKSRNANSFDLWVVNNTRPLNTAASTIRTRYAPYADRYTDYVADLKKVAQTLTLTAGLGWDKTTSKLLDANRVSGPYNVIVLINSLETVAKIAAGGAAAAKSPDFTVLWSISNAGGSTSPTDDFDAGLTSNSAWFNSYYKAIDTTGKSTGAWVADNIMFLSGSQAAALSELSTSSVLHETFHYVQSSRTRSYQPGGPHSAQSEQDPALAWEEGFADGVPALVTGRSRPARIYPYNGTLIDNNYDISGPISGSPVGWFQEMSIARLLWSLQDPAGSAKLSTQAILAPLFSTAWQQGVWMPNVWAYGKLLKAQQPAVASAIDALGTTLNITLVGNDEWATAEQKLGSLTASQTLPVFARVAPGSTTNVCSVGAKNDYNKLGNRRYLRVDGDGRSHSLTVTGPTGSVPLLTTTDPATADQSNFFVAGARSFTRSVVLPSSGTWAAIGDCSVTRSSFAENVTACSQTTAAPAEQCWSITVSP